MHAVVAVVIVVVVIVIIVIIITVIMSVVSGASKNVMLPCLGVCCIVVISSDDDDNVGCWVEEKSLSALVVLQGCWDVVFAESSSSSFGSILLACLKTCFLFEWQKP